MEERDTVPVEDAIYDVVGPEGRDAMGFQNPRRYF
jgi:hypothetical protein